MLDKTDFAAMHTKLADYDKQRENLIKTSRDVIKLSKTIIYAVHRDELKTAKKAIEDSKKILITLNAMIAKEPGLYYEGAYKAAVQEYVEGVLYYSYVKDATLMTHTQLAVSTDHYLLGLCDLTGELARRAIVAASNGKPEEVKPIRDITAEIYQTLLTFDIRSGELRKKFDQIKYDLRRLDDAAFQLSLRK